MQKKTVCVIFLILWFVGRIMMESSSLCINWMFYYRVWNHLWHCMPSCKERQCVLFYWFCDPWVESWWNCIASYFCMLDYALLKPYVTVHRIVLELYDLFWDQKKILPANGLNENTSHWAHWLVGLLFCVWIFELPLLQVRICFWENCHFIQATEFLKEQNF